MPSSPSGELAAIIANYSRSLMQAARELGSASTERVILAGKLHHVDPDEEPRFEAYLIHLVGTDGSVATSRYTMEVFAWDDPAIDNGERFRAACSDDIGDDCSALRDYAEVQLPLGKFSAANGMEAIEGIIWFPDDDGLPIVYANINGPDAPPRFLETQATGKTYTRHGDGTVGGELRARDLANKELPGVFRGQVVDRLAHRPPEMTLAEILTATNALGYWHQVETGDQEPSQLFMLSQDQSYADMVLQQVDGETDQWAYGNAYASAWHARSGIRWRLLAVGTVPQLTRVSRD
jgi:hypothetical protein